MKKSFLIILLIIFSLISAFVYFYPKIGYSPIPSQWDVRTGYARYSIINTGSFPAKQYSLTWQSDLSNNANYDIFSKILSAMINLSTGTTSFVASDLFAEIFPWAAIIFLPIIVIYFYRKVAKNEGKSVRPDEKSNWVDYILLYLFAVFPYASVTFSMSLGLDNAFARAYYLMILAMIIVFLADFQKSRYKLGIVTLSFIAFFNYQHTWSYYLVISLGVLFLISLRIKDRLMANVAILGTFIFFAVSIFYNTDLLKTPSRLVNSLSNFISNFPSLTNQLKINPAFSGYTTLGSTYSFLQVVSSFLIITICLIFIGQYIKNKKKEKPKSYEKLLFYFIIAEFFIGFALIIFNGFLGVYSRIFESLSYFTMLLAAFLLIKTSGRLKTAIRVTILCLILICAASYLISPDQKNLQLTQKEFEGIAFAGEHVPKYPFIFTDFRLGPSLVYYGQAGVKTIDARLYTPEKTNEILERCYYNISNPETILDNFTTTRNYYVIISSGPILDPSNTVFKSPSSDFENQWAQQKAFNAIYSSQNFDVYQRIHLVP